MNVLVTGGAGYIGSVCTEELLNTGIQVTVFDNLSEGHRQAVDPRARLIEGDLLDRTAILDAIRSAHAEAVVHFAASALVGESMTDPGKYFRNNSCAGLNLLDACHAGGVRKIVFSSTCATYGIPARVPIDESTPQCPVNPYGESKLMLERMTSWYRQIHGLEVAGFRYFNAAGASRAFGEHHRIETHLIPNVLKVALGQRESVDLYGTDYPTPDGSCIRDYIHVIDLALAHIHALEPGREGYFNLGTGSGYSVRQVIETCERVTGRPIRVTEKPRRPGDPPSLVANPAKARTTLEWRPRFPDLESIVRSAWDWHVRHPAGYPG